MYQGTFKTMLEEITIMNPGLSVNILDECAATAIHQNIHDHNALFENINSSGHIGISIQYRQNEEQVCGFFSLASDLNHVQDKELGYKVQNYYHCKVNTVKIVSQVKQCVEIFEKEGKMGSYEYEKRQ